MPIHQRSRSNVAFVCFLSTAARRPKSRRRSFRAGWLESDRWSIAAMGSRLSGPRAKLSGNVSRSLHAHPWLTPHSTVPHCSGETRRSGDRNRQGPHVPRAFQPPKTDQIAHLREGVRTSRLLMSQEAPGSAQDSNRGRRARGDEPTQATPQHLARLVSVISIFTPGCKIGVL